MTDILNITSEKLEQLEKTYPELIKLILNSTALWYETNILDPKDYELSKEYWLNVLPDLNPENRENLYNILENERLEKIKILEWFNFN